MCCFAKCMFHVCSHLAKPSCQVVAPGLFQQCCLASAPPCNKKALEHADDVIACCKHHWSDMCLAQPPFLALPFSYLEKLVGPGPSDALPRNKLSERTLAEYRRCAMKVGEMPWNMSAAKEYLEMWCMQNESGHWPPPEPLGWVVTASLAVSKPAWWHQQLEPSEEWTKYAPGRPAHMHIASAPSRKRRALQSVPAVQNSSASEVPQALPVPAVPRALGCPKCRMSARGCAQCRNIEYRMRAKRLRAP